MLHPNMFEYGKRVAYETGIRFTTIRIHMLAIIYEMLPPIDGHS